MKINIENKQKLGANSTIDHIRAGTLQQLLTTDAKTTMRGK